MSEITSASINTLPSERQAGFESPSEQLIVLTYSQLQDLIVQAVQEAIQPLQDEIAPEPPGDSCLAPENGLPRDLARARHQQDLR